MRLLVAIPFLMTSTVGAAIPLPGDSSYVPTEFPVNPYEDAFNDMLWLDVPSEYETVQEAIDASGLWATIRLAEGEYTGNYTIEGKGVYIVAQGSVLLTPMDDAPIFTINDTPEEELVHLFGLKMQTAANPRWPENDLQDGNAILANAARLQLTNCDFQFCHVGTGSDQEPGNGGGINALSSDIWIDQCGFWGCQASGKGGAIYAFASSIEMRETRVGFSDAGSDGGGVYMGLGDLVAEQCVFESNTAGAAGGQIHIKGGDLVATRCMFEDGMADDGGALLLEELAADNEFFSFAFSPEASLKEVRFASNYSSKPATGTDVIKQKDGLATSTQDVWFCGSKGCDGVSSPEAGVKYADDCVGCYADTNFDGITDVQDLIDVLQYWGTRDPFANIAELNWNDEKDVNAADLIEVIQAFGTCGSEVLVIQ